MADVPEGFDGHLSGWQVDDALDRALQGPAPMPTPGPGGQLAAESLRELRIDRRLWVIHLQNELDDPADLEAYRRMWFEADRRAVAQEPPPRPART